MIGGFAYAQRYDVSGKLEICFSLSVARPTNSSGALGALGLGATPF